MNILFEIADSDLLIIGVILAAIFVVIALVFRAIVNKNRVMPISEDERFDNEDNFEEKKPLTDEQKKAKEELERVYAQMSMDLEKQEDNEIQEERLEEKDNIDEFEREQEENAIISYQELMAAAEKLKKQADKYEAYTEDNADVRVHEAVNTYKEHTEKNIKPEVQKEHHGFKNSEIISPIYGIQKEKKKSSLNRQSNGIISKAYEEAITESEQNMDFLNSLKEFRKNL